MPWDCGCGASVLDDETTCPSCGDEKTSWTLHAEQTRTLVVDVSGARLEVLRATTTGGAPAWAPAQVAPAVPASTARALATAGTPPTDDDVLLVRVQPGRATDRRVRVAPAFETRAMSEAAFEPAAGPGGALEARLLCVFAPAGEDVADLRVPGAHVVDVSEAGDAGAAAFAPAVEVSAVRKGPVRVTLERRRRRLDLVELEDALFRTESAVVLPGGEDPDATTPTAVSLAAACLRYVDEHPGRRVLVAGHTDTTGAAAYNVALSEQRAACAHAVLVGDRAGFVAVAHARHVTKDLQQVLRWVARTRGWPCDPGAVDGVHGPTTTAAIRGFQEGYNGEKPAGAEDLVVDGVVGPKTWGGFFDCYEHALLGELGCDPPGLPALRARLVPLDPALPRVGCGEAHPIEAAGRDGYRSQTNRRVEVLLFEPGEEPSLACHAGGACDPARCEVYDPARWDRRPLPPMLSALPWSAAWEGAARKDEAARMVLVAPGLPAGQPVTFVVTQEGQGEVGRVEATSQDGRCEAGFTAWFHPARVGPRVHLGPDEDFPPVRFAFRALAGGREVAAAPITYEDVLNAVLVLDDGAVLREREFVLHSPWGTRRGRTDADGHAVVRRLPPGGVRIGLAGTLVGGSA